MALLGERIANVYFNPFPTPEGKITLENLKDLEITWEVNFFKMSFLEFSFKGRKYLFIKNDNVGSVIPFEYTDLKDKADSLCKYVYDYEYNRRR